MWGEKYWCILRMLQEKSMLQLVQTVRSHPYIRGKEKYWDALLASTPQLLGGISTRKYEKKNITRVMKHTLCIVCSCSETSFSTLIATWLQINLETNSTISPTPLRRQVPLNTCEYVPVNSGRSPTILTSYVRSSPPTNAALLVVLDIVNEGDAVILLLPSIRFQGWANGDNHTTKPVGVSAKEIVRLGLCHSPYSNYILLAQAIIIMWDILYQSTWNSKEQGRKPL